MDIFSVMLIQVNQDFILKHAITEFFILNEGQKVINEGELGKIDYK